MSNLPAYSERGKKAEASGWGDWPFVVVKERLVSAAPQDGDYIVTGYLIAQAPAGSKAFTNHAWVISPGLGFGKGWEDFDIEGGITFALTSNLEKSCDGIVIRLEADAINEDVEKTVALGLNVNEGIRNAVKHAFTPGAKGVIRICLCEEGRAEATLTISDDGKGRNGRAEGSGTRLVKALARQIGGHIEWPSQPQGTTLRLVFPRRVPDIGLVRNSGSPA